MNSDQESTACVRNKKFNKNNKSGNFLAKIKPTVGKAALQKFTLSGWRENLKKKYIVKAREDDILLRRFSNSISSSLQESSFKTHNAQKNCHRISDLPPEKTSSGNERILNFDALNGNHLLTHQLKREEPPAPPPRNAPPLPPSLPPVPSSLVLCRGLKTPVFPSINHQPNSPSFSNNLSVQRTQCFNVYEIQKKLLNATSVSYYDRNSPSSGFYSCTSVSFASPSSPSIYDSNQLVDKSAISWKPVLQSVKSRRLNKPQPETAILVSICAEPPDPPPPYPVTVVHANKPPSYASSVPSLPVSPIVTVLQPATPTNSDEKVHCHFSVPAVRKSSSSEDDRRDSKVRNYSPQAFKFFMEQHMENVIKLHKQRDRRRMQLEREMKEMGLNAEERSQMREMLRQKESNFIRLKRSKMDVSMFTRIQVIGTGAFGEVSLVRKNNSHQLYAMKTLRKADVLRRNQVAHVKAERDILAEADNDWVVKLYFSFQDTNYLYFVMEYIPGGDLMSLLIKLGIFEEKLARFYVAELTCAVESVHKIGFIHRDIKPDNILIDHDGHIKLTDFGLCTGFRWTHNSKYYENGHSRQNSMEWSTGVDCKCVKLKPLERRRRREENQRCLAHSLVGTPNYIAPEVLLRGGYTQLCDWWSVGVVLYEMLIGYPPFRDDSTPRTQEKIINWRHTFHIPSNANIAPEAADLILKLCTSPDKRLGKNADEVKRHPFLAEIDFAGGVRKLRPPYVPKIVHSMDTSNFDPVLQSYDSDAESSSLHSNSSHESDLPGWPSNNNEFFAEFTFRRFFDDDGGTAFREKNNNLDDQESQNAIYV